MLGSNPHLNIILEKGVYDLVVLNKSWHNAELSINIQGRKTYLNYLKQRE